MKPISRKTYNIIQWIALALVATALTLDFVVHAKRPLLTLGMSFLAFVILVTLWFVPKEK
jgi:hypothetical protein